MSQDDQSESTEAAPNRDPMAAARLLLGGSAHSDSGTDGPIETSGPRGDDEVVKDETAAGRISSSVLSMEHLLSTTANNKFQAVYRAAASEFGVTAADLYLTFINNPGNANVRLVKQMAPDSPSRLVLGLCGSDDLKSQSYPNQSRRLLQAHPTVEAVVLLFRDGKQGWTAKLGYERPNSQLADTAKSIWPKALFEEIELLEVEKARSSYWWSSDSDERYWMEISDRPDPGTDLNAPALNEDGNEYWSYSFVKEVLDGDVVFHWSKRKGSEAGIIGYSSVSGPHWEDEVLWSARGTRSREVSDYARPGFRRALVGFTRMEEVTTLMSIRQMGSEVLEVADLLEAEHGNLATYFPFTRYGPDPSKIRTAQGYLVKFPSSLVELLGLEVPMPQTDFPGNVLKAVKPQEDVGKERGVPYRVADEEAGVSTAEPNSPDPALVERGLHAHRRTQNSLAEWLTEGSLTPLSPSPVDPDWDIAWYDGSLFRVCEVKSLTDSNEERQLRMGLGQVLRYRQQLGGNATAVLALEREPKDPSWLTLCERLEIQVAWDGQWDRLI